ncbi:MAG: glycosyltransferase [Liquorilactobacillus hordei]|uniref:glycosyltransferase n=1 Tax=Liquorilactobacillus hordei TaxID=468911 RepID=UPI0039EA11CB
MKISIVMSTYNGEKFVIEQLDSLRNQTVSANEVIIADDCSTDNTVSLISNYIAKYKLTSWSVLVNQENLGWRKNFMEALWKSNGEIVFTCDQDDIWRQDKLEIMTNLMNEHKEISLLTSNYKEFYDDGHTTIGPWKNDKKLKQITLNNNYFLVKSPGCTHCVRRDLVELSKKYWEPEYPHDALLWRLAIFSNGLYSYTDTLINWRKHTTSAFAKESFNLKTISEKKKWIKISQNFQNTLKTFIKNDVSSDVNHQKSVLKRNDKWLSTRYDFYDYKSILTGIKLSFYWDCFPRYRQYLGDWYLIFIKRK